MAWIRCKKCNKRVSDKNTNCPKCGAKIKITNSNYVNVLVKVGLIILEIVLMLLVIAAGKKVLFIEKAWPLMFLFGSILLLLICTCFNIFKVLKSLKNIWFLLNFVIISCSFGLSLVYGYKGVNALIHENSMTLYNLTEKYSLKEAKRLKRGIEEIFAYDDGDSVRDVVIGNFYKDNDEYILYLDDFYNNYRLKFYVLMNKDDFTDIYWMFDDQKLYLVKNGKKTDEFAYYYAMYIVNNVIGENVSGRVRIEDDVENILKKKFDNSSNIIISYDEFQYDSKSDTFSYKCTAQSMDYYTDISNEDFTIYFERLTKAKKKKVWYYGDASFDYVNLSVKF